MMSSTVLAFASAERLHVAIYEGVARYTRLICTCGRWSPHGANFGRCSTGNAHGAAAGLNAVCDGGREVPALCRHNPAPRPRPAMRQLRPSAVPLHPPIEVSATAEQSALELSIVIATTLAPIAARP